MQASSIARQALADVQAARLAPLFAALALGACAQLAATDGVFSVAGTLPANVSTCDLLLRTEDGAEVPSTRRKVGPEFHEDFSVASEGVYELVAECGNAASKIATIHFGTLVTSGDTVIANEIAHKTGATDVRKQP